MSESKKAVHEPLVRIVKRDGISFKNKALIRAASIVLALVVDALFIYFVTGLNPLSVYAVISTDGEAAISRPTSTFWTLPPERRDTGVLIDGVTTPSSSLISSARWRGALRSAMGECPAP